MRTKQKVGDIIQKDDLLGLIADPFGERETELRASGAGLIIGRANLPVVNQGDALFHVATLSDEDFSGPTVDELEEEFDGDPLFAQVLGGLAEHLAELVLAQVGRRSLYYSASHSQVAG